MGDTVLERYTAGQGRLVPVDHTGPASYTTGGEVLGNSSSLTGQAVVGLGGIDAVLCCEVSDSGNYYVKSQPSGAGSRKTFNLLWFAAGVTQGVSSVAITAEGSGMTVGTVPLVFSGGGGSGAAGTFTATSATVGTVTITNPGSGYTSAPTVSAATGGTPPTLTASIGSVSGGQVAAGTDLAAETVRLVYVGR